jgi:methionyl-tRNA formyltransferase
MPSRGIYNLIRGLARPYVGASFLLGGQEIKVWKSEIYPWKKENLEPGKVVKITSAGPVVKCGEGALCLLEVEPVFDFYLGMYL